MPDPDDLAERAAAFCQVSIMDWTDRPVRMLAETPELGSYGFATALVLGDAVRVRKAITHDPAAATTLHAAAYAGSAETVRLLLARGAGIAARDTTWDSTPLEWAKVGSGRRPRSGPRPDWVETVRTLLEAGASTEALELSPDDLKPASPEVANILRVAGVRERAADNGGASG